MPLQYHHKDDVNLNRLLRSVEALLAAPDACSEEQQLRVQIFLKTAQELLTKLQDFDWRTSPDCVRTSAEQISEYRRHIDLLVRQANPEKLAVSVDQELLSTRIGAAQHQSTADATREIMAMKVAQARAEQSIRDELFAGFEPAKPDTAGPADDEDAVGDNFEEMTEDLADLAHQLKEHAQSMQDIVARDNKAADEIRTLQDKGLTRVNAENSKLKKLMSETFTSTVLIWTLLVFVSIVFCVMYMFMRIFPKVR
eukprot:TRINITY_DN7012_c0_g1_i1.p2 TRINITY_DN7012_c0_g1~~TRINITY_DN7012_c0_g1_i1.p2  ORF type:complete len:254 (+),score=58.94 TRINITY_DN7012_c0_g1_i1:56-817(+)